MSDPASSPTVTPPASTSAPRGYFNQSQLEDLDQAETILAAALSNAAALDEQDITAIYLEGFSAHVTETRTRASESGQGKVDAKAATELAGAAATALFTALQQIQSSAKQKHKMLAEDGDPSTNFATDGYLIGTRLNGSRANLLQNADTLVLRLQADSLPGFKTPAKIAVVTALLAAYRGSEGEQQDTIRDKEVSRLDRDQLIHVLNTRRSSIQHAADALWPWSSEANRPIRKTFALPLNRAMGM
jgi:HPt (histidine-containing phosphotransfer) domain-containing protein